jgi:hypothetical protein
MTKSFTQAVEKRDTAVVVDPRTGTVLDLAGEHHELLIDVLLEIRRRDQQLKEWRQALEDELIRRHGDRRGAQVVGDHEVDVDRGWGRVWDPDELLEVIEGLIGRDLVALTAVSDIVTKVPKVDGRKAQALLSRLDGDALVELRRCFRWEQRGRAKVKVTPVASLEP